MTQQSVKTPEPQRDKPKARAGQPFDLAEILRKARAEALGTLAPHSF